MKSIQLFILLLLSLVCKTDASTAQQGGNEKITINKSDLPPEVAERLQMKYDSTEFAQKVESYGKWVGVGHEIGTAFNESLQAVSKNAQELSDSNLGHFIMFMVGYTVVGRDIIAKLIGILLLACWIWIFVWHYKRNCMPLLQTVVTKEGNKTTKTTSVVDKRNSSENYTERFVSVAIFIILFLVICASFIA